jgi:hypothetical protein
LENQGKKKELEKIEAVNLDLRKKAEKLIGEIK